MIVFILLAFVVSCVASAVMTRPKPTVIIPDARSFFYIHDYAMRRLGWGLFFVGFLPLCVLLGIEWLASNAMYYYDKFMNTIDPHPAASQVTDEEEHS